jgi:CheY-like chemotaxis protein
MGNHDGGIKLFCLQLVQTKQFDAILLDVSMPRMDGYEVYERLQSNPMTRSIPVILLTAKVLPSERERFSRMDVAGVIAKPIEPIALTEAIAQMLGWDE